MEEIVCQKEFTKSYEKLESKDFFSGLRYSKLFVQKQSMLATKRKLPESIGSKFFALSAR